MKFPKSRVITAYGRKSFLALPRWNFGRIRASIAPTDTPCDADAAGAAGLLPIGVQSGHFSRSALFDAGCTNVFFDLRALARKLEERASENSDSLRSHTAAAADSR